MLRRTFPNCHAVWIDGREHNVMLYFHHARLSRLFCACLFEDWHTDIRSDLLALVSKTAHSGYGTKTDRTKKLSNELEAVYESASWRRTKPLRKLAGGIKRLRRGLFIGR